MTAIGNKLYIFGGRAGEDLLYNDLHVFDTGKSLCACYFALDCISRGLIKGTVGRIAALTLLLLA